MKSAILKIVNDDGTGRLRVSVVFSGTVDRMDLLPAPTNPRWRPAAILDILNDDISGIGRSSDQFRAKCLMLAARESHIVYVKNKRYFLLTIRYELHRLNWFTKMLQAKTGIKYPETNNLSNKRTTKLVLGCIYPCEREAYLFTHSFLTCTSRKCVAPNVDVTSVSKVDDSEPRQLLHSGDRLLDFTSFFRLARGRPDAACAGEKNLNCC